MTLNLDLDKIREEIDSAPHGAKSAIKDRFAGMAGVSRATLERALSKKFGAKFTIKKESKISESLIDEIAKIKERGKAMSRGQKERELSTEICIQMLVDQGVPGAENLTVTTMNRLLKKKGYRDPDPKVRIEAYYANQEWQLDFSRSKYFQVFSLDERRDDWILKCTGRELHYKKDDRKMRLWICQLKDSYSRLRIARAYAATSEDGLIGLKTIHYILNRPSSDPHLMKHVPDMIKTDQGSFSKRKEVRAAMDALGIDLRRSKAGNKDSQGKVESGFASIWSQFELPLALGVGHGGTIYLSEYNDMMAEFFWREHAKEHTVWKDTRGAVYQLSTMTHPQNHVDVDILKVACRVEKRGPIKGDLLVSFGGIKYEAPSYCAGKTIRVYKNLKGDLMGEIEDTDRPLFILKPPPEGAKFPFREIDDFSHRPHATYRQKMETEVEHESKYYEGDRLFMTTKNSAREVDSVFMRQDDSYFSDIRAAKIYINTQIKAITGDGSYADYSAIFDPLLEVSFNKEPIEEALNRMRMAVREISIKVAE